MRLRAGINKKAETTGQMEASGPTGVIPLSAECPSRRRPLTLRAAPTQKTNRQRARTRPSTSTAPGRICRQPVRKNHMFSRTPAAKPGESQCYERRRCSQNGNAAARVGFLALIGQRPPHRHASVRTLSPASDAPGLRLDRSIILLRHRPARQNQHAANPKPEIITDPRDVSNQLQAKVMVATRALGHHSSARNGERTVSASI